MSQVVQEFLRRLQEEEAIAHPQLAEDRYGLAFLTAIKEFDNFYYNMMRHESSDDASEQLYFMRLGIPRFIEMMLDSVPRFGLPAATFKSDRVLILAALGMVARFGFIENGKRMAFAVMAGECELVKVSESLFEFRLPKTFFNYEATESYVESFHRQQRREKRDAILSEAFAKKGILEHLDRCFEENVYVFHKNYIGYDAHPDLDDFFFGLAYSEIQDLGAFDTFHYSLTFGGLKFLHYILAIAYLLSISFKHERFCEALVQKHPEIRLRDILVVTADKNEFIATLQAALNHYGQDFENYTPISLDEATRLYNVLSVRRENLRLNASSAMCAPPLVEFSDVTVIKSNAGIQLDLSAFLLESLRRHFPREYDSHQQTRERSMQKALKRLLSETFPELEFRGNLRIREHGRVMTDVDFVAIDRASRIAIFFQLKYQDHYGGDMRKRSSRGGRLKKETELWLNRVNQWLSSTPRHQICTSLQIKKDVQLDHIRTVAIGKHFAHFLAPLAKDENFAYASWVQFYDALSRIRASGHEPRTLAALFEILRTYMSHKTAVPQRLEGSDAYTLDTVSYRIVQTS